MPWCCIIVIVLYLLCESLQNWTVEYGMQAVALCYLSAGMGEEDLPDGGASSRAV